MNGAGTRRDAVNEIASSPNSPSSRTMRTRAMPDAVLEVAGLLRSRRRNRFDRHTGPRLRWLFWSPSVKSVRTIRATTVLEVTVLGAPGAPIVTKFAATAGIGAMIAARKVTVAVAPGSRMPRKAVTIRAAVALLTATRVAFGLAEPVMLSAIGVMPAGTVSRNVTF